MIAWHWEVTIANQQAEIERLRGLLRKSLCSDDEWTDEERHVLDSILAGATVQPSAAPKRYSPTIADGSGWEIGDAVPTMEEDPDGEWVRAASSPDVCVWTRPPEGLVMDRPYWKPSCGSVDVAVDYFGHTYCGYCGKPKSFLATDPTTGAT